MADFEQHFPQASRRSEWEPTMQVFGVMPDVDAASHRRRVKEPTVVASRAEVGRRAADYGDIVDLLGKRHFPNAHKSAARGGMLAGHEELNGASAGRGAELEAVDIDARSRRRRPATARAAPTSGVLPFESEAYDAPSQHRRRFFDGTVHARHYADLLGRPGSPSGDRQFAGGAYGDEGDEVSAQQLPLAIRRALEAALPSSTDPKYNPEVADRIRAQVEAMVLRRWTGRKARPAKAPQPRKNSGGMSAESTLAPHDFISRESQGLSTEETHSTELDYEVPYYHALPEPMPDQHYQGLPKEVPVLGDLPVAEQDQLLAPLSDQLPAHTQEPMPEAVQIQVQAQALAQAQRAGLPTLLTRRPSEKKMGFMGDDTYGEA